MKAMILAAGTGTRLRPLTALRPKPLFPVYTVPLLHITVERLVKAGVREIMVNSHHLSRQITDFLEHHTGSGASLSHSHEPDLLGTGGAVKKVEWFWGQEPFLVVNGDILHTVDLMAAYRTHVANGNLATLILHEYPRFNNVEVDGEGTIVGMRDKKVRETSSATTMLAFTGIHIISPQLLDEIPPLRYVDIIEIYGDLAARGLNIRGHRTRDHYWRDIGTPEDYHCIHRDIYENRMHLADTVTLPAPAANGSTIGEGTTLGGYVSLGKNSRIGRNCSITDSIIWDNVSINDNCTIRNCIIGDGASVNNSKENGIVA
jgi:NDP-sugar pyrophosphorylase family protein